MRPSCSARSPPAAAGALSRTYLETLSVSERLKIVFGKGQRQAWETQHFTSFHCRPFSVVVPLRCPRFRLPRATRTYHLRYMFDICSMSSFGAGDPLREAEAPRAPRDANRRDLGCDRRTRGADPGLLGVEEPAGLRRGCGSRGVARLDPEPLRQGTPSRVLRPTPPHPTPPTPLR